jgi:hypothetical protein
MNGIALLQQTTDLASIVKDYGWIGIIILLFFDRVLPVLREHFSATHKRRMAQEDEDRARTAKREERIITVLEQFGGQLQTFGLAMTVTTERLTSIERDQESMQQALVILADRKQQQRVRGSGD